MEDVEVLLQSARSSAELSKWNEVIECCNMILRLQSNVLLAYYMRSIAFEELGDFENCILDLNMCLSLETHQEQIGVHYARRAFLWNRVGDFEKAVRDASKSSELNPEYIVALKERIFALNQLGKTEKAIDDCEALLRLTKW